MKEFLLQVALLPYNVIVFIAWLYVAIFGLILFPFMAFGYGFNGAWKMYKDARVENWEHIYSDYY